MARIIVLVTTLLTCLTSCGISISPIPGVSIYIPLPHEIGKKSDDKKDEGHNLQQRQ